MTALYNVCIFYAKNKVKLKISLVKRKKSNLKALSSTLKNCKLMTALYNVCILYAKNNVTFKISLSKRKKSNYRRVIVDNKVKKNLI